MSLYQASLELECLPCGPNIELGRYLLTKKGHEFKGAAAYQLGNTGSRTITEVKQH